MLRFGRELLKDQNWEAKLPFFLVNVHHAIAQRQKYKFDYYKNDDVWKDIQSVYEGYLAEYPDEALARSTYARLAGWAGKFDVADRQFEILKDKAVPEVFGGVDAMNRRKADAASKGR
jgi:hypothetical protein